MKRKLWVALTAIFALVLSFAMLTSCSVLDFVTDKVNGVLKTVVSMEVVGVPEDGITIGEFDEAGIRLKVTYVDKTEETVSVTKELVKEEDRQLLTTVGTHTIRVVYQNAETSFTVKMLSNVIATELAVIGVPEDGIIIGMFNQAGIQLKVKYSDDTENTVPVTESMLKEEDRQALGSAGVYDVTVTYQGLTKTFSVKMVDEVTIVGIQVIDVPEVGIIEGTFDNAGIRLEISFSDETKEYLNLKEDMFEQSQRALLSTVGRHNVALTYANIETTFQLQVNELTVVESLTITNVPSFGIVKGTLNEAGIQVEVKYSNGSKETKDLTEDMIAEDSFELLNTVGEHQIQVIYAEGSTTFTLKVRELSYVITFVNALEEVVSRLLYYPNGEAIQPPSSEQMQVDGFTFKGTFNKDFSAPTTDLIIKGEYVKIVTVKFYNPNGDLLSTQTLESGQDAVAPTDYKMDNVCKLIAWDGEFTNVTTDLEIRALIATHITSGWLTEKNATCTEDGSKYKVCTICLTELARETLSALNHNHVVVASERNTCETGGYQKYRCANNCGDEYYTESIPTGHNYVYQSRTKVGNDYRVSLRCDRCYKSINVIATEKKVVLGNCKNTGYIEYEYSYDDYYTVHTKTFTTGSLPTNKQHRLGDSTLQYENGQTYHYTVEKADVLRRMFDERVIRWSAGVASKCDETKLAGYYCADCNELVVIYLTGEHTFDNGTTASCVTDAQYTCTACGYSYTDNSQFAKGHKYEYVEDSFNATAKTVTVKCSECGNTVKNVGVQKGSTYSAQNCKEESYTEYITTSSFSNGLGSSHVNYKIANVVCKIMSDTQPAHNIGGLRFVHVQQYTYSGEIDLLISQGKIRWTVGEPATCSEHKLAGFDCETCGELVAINLSGKHSLKLNEPLLCTQSGTFKCTLCGVNYYQPAKQHQFKNVITELPKCTEDGVMHRKCIVCAFTTEDYKIPATGHAYVTVVEKQAKCNEDGLIKYVCPCGYSYTRTIRAEHDMVELERVPSTCTEDGYIKYGCKNCDAEDHEEILTKGHAYEISVVKNIITYTCSVCGHTYQEYFKGIATSGNVLLIQDRIPWEINNGVSLMKRLQRDGIINGWTLTTTSNLKNVDLYQYEVIYIANDQTTSTYNALATFNDDFTLYAKRGGIVIYGACDKGWANGNISYTLPGGVQRTNYYSRHNYIIDYSHPIVTAVNTDGKGLSDYLLEGTYCSHSAFTVDTLPEGYNAILQDSRGIPTLVEYQLGDGYIIASGLTWEFYYTRSFKGDTTYSKNVYDDLIIYAMSLATPCDHVLEFVEIVKPTCYEMGYTKYKCIECGRTIRAEYVDKVDHAPYFVSANGKTCTTNGNIEHYKCDICGKCFSEEECINEILDVVIPAGHSYSDTFTYNATHHWYSATCGHSVEKDKATHSLSAWFTVTDRLTNQLIKKRVCACGYVETQNIDTGTITGRVYSLTASGASLLSGVTVKISGNGASMTVVTDASGSYSFSGLRYGTYQITVSKANYVTSNQTCVLNVRSMQNENIYLVSSTSTNPGTASGYAKDATTAYGISGITINVRNGLNNTSGNILQTLVTNNNGYYKTNNLPAGNYTFEFVDNRNVATKYSSTVINVAIIANVNLTDKDATMVNVAGMSGKIRVVLTWGANPSDLDSHLYMDSGKNGSYDYHVYYGKKTLNNAMLDVDDITSYGPETTTITIKSNTIYHYGIYNYSGGGSSVLSNSDAKVMVYIGESGTPLYTFNVPNGNGRYWNIFSYNSDTGVFTINDTITATQPSA